MIDSIDNLVCKCPQTIAAADELESVMDLQSSLVFYIKLADGRYSHANLTFVRRLGLKRREEVVGHSATELFSTSSSVSSFAWKDEQVLQGESLENELEMPIYPSQVSGWCLTYKRPFRELDKIGGIVGISRDLRKPNSFNPSYIRLYPMLEYLEEHFAERMNMRTLASLRHISVAHLKRDIMDVFKLTPRQLQSKLRIGAALHMLAADRTVAAIAQDCGFRDQSTFAQQFKAIVGMTPSGYHTLRSDKSKFHSRCQANPVLPGLMQYR